MSDREVFILEKLDDLTTSVAEIHAQITNLQCVQHARIVTELDQTVRGNGREGLVTRVSKLESISRIKEKFLWLMTGGFVSAIVAILLTKLT